MPDKPDSHAADTEKGFGTGLRAQLQRRRADAPDAPAEEAGAPAATPGDSVSDDVASLMAELADAFQVATRTLSSGLGR